VTEEEGVQWVRGTVRAVMVKRRFTYAQLVDRLAELGIEENERNLRNKVARGTFSAVFFVACLEAMGVERLALEMHRELAKPESERAFAEDVPAVTAAMRTAIANEEFVRRVRKIVATGATVEDLNSFSSEFGRNPEKYQDAKSAEPSMEEILASIRAMLRDDDPT
jgi:hypothetical protein